ncbi:GDP-mannose dehydrogenase [Pseudaestuariivita atlantica]|uniref:UDP-glucose 6-dehydrogenase n=1 Tax=Pseudaestuariivita atlantica TaxID=1317121 RepID=A0A0L1JN77_9RHOB|nr:GDP-mannose dehydrogenase [Pseudaestuariivita atlantica]
MHEEKPAVSVVGLGYVGAVSTACLSSLGHRVVGVDLDQVKIDQIGAGLSPIHEDGLGDLLSHGVAEGLISTTDDLIHAVRTTDVTFVSVGTPTAADGGCDYSYIESAARSIGVGIAQKKTFHTVVMRCSIPPGTTMKVMTPIIEKISGKVLGTDFGVAFNPEFLREGVAVADFHEPPKTVIGATCARSAGVLKRIYAPVDDRPIITSIETAEMVKYVDNVWHAAKVTFANEVGRLCKPLGVDSHEVMDVFVQDTKLNLSPYYLKPGFAYGGSCLPKEVRAVAHIADGLGLDLPLIQNLCTSNDAHIAEATEMVRKTGAKRVGILGLAFKPGTDDLRESPILEVIAALRAEGVEVTIHDPAITPDTPLEGQLAYVKHGSKGLQALAPELKGMLRADVTDVTTGAEALIVTQKSADYRFAALNAECPVIDLVRLTPERVSRDGYDGIGW